MSRAVQLVLVERSSYRFSAIVRIWVVRTSRHRTHAGGPRRVSRTWQRIRVVANPRSYSKHKRVQSHSCHVIWNYRET